MFCNLSLGAVSECAMDLCVAMAWTFQVGCQRIFLLGEAQWLLHPSYINPHTDMLYLQKVSGAMGCGNNNNNGGESVVLGTVDVKDSFFMVDQVTPMAVSLLGRTYKVKKNLPGQRLGARAWYWAFRETLVRNLACHGAPNSHAWLEINSAEVLQSAFTVARCWMWDAVLEKNLEACWYRFGFGSRNKRHEGGWDVCNSSIQTEDRSDFLSGPDACALRFQICDWNPLDQIFFFAVEELSSPIFKPTYCSWKVAQADWLSENNKWFLLKWKSSEKYWLLETFSDSDWSGHQSHRRSTSWGIHASTVASSVQAVLSALAVVKVSYMPWLRACVMASTFEGALSSWWIQR